jgi:Tol biopolymer transport system component/DNA-binding winged helix-turn-helix (wHTH) protein
METRQPKPDQLCFGEFLLDTQRRGLYLHQERVRLTAKPLEALIFLVENSGRTVTKQELLDAVWKDTFVTEDVLIHAIRDIRRALGDDKDNPLFIQTIPRQGYRFVCAVRTPETSVPEAVDANADSAVPTSAQAATTLAGLPQRYRRWVWLVLGASLCAALLIGALRLFHQAEGRLYQLPVSTIKQITSGEFSSGKPVFSPDGKFILYVSSSEETRGFGDLFIRQFPEGNAQRITNKIDPSGDLAVFTADGHHVVFSLPRKDSSDIRHHDLWIVPSFGGPPKRYLEDASGAGFSPDGKWVAYTKHLPSGDILWISPVENLEVHSAVMNAAYTPRWSPNGEWLAFTTSNPNEGSGNFWRCKVTQSEGGKAAIFNQQQITQEKEQVYGLSWSTDSNFIFFASKRNGPLQLYRISMADARVSALAPGVGDYAAPSLAPDGHTLIFQHFRLVNNLMTATLGTPCDAKNITFEQFHLNPRLSPSGEKLASVVEELDQSKRLYLTDLKTRMSSQLSTRDAHHPCWIDEENLAFLSSNEPSQTTAVYKVNLKTREETRVTDFTGKANWLTLHAGGNRLAVVVKAADGIEKIVMRDLTGQVDTVIHEGSEYEYLRWLPDGQTLCWSQPGASRDAPHISGGIWAITIGEREPRLLVKDGFCPVWSDDGKTLYFSGKQGQSGLWIYRPQEQTEQLLCAWEQWGLSFDIVGHRLIFVQHKNNSQLYALSLTQP